MHAQSFRKILVQYFELLFFETLAGDDYNWVVGYNVNENPSYCGSLHIWEPLLHNWGPLKAH